MTCKDCIHYEVCERKDGTSTYTVEDPSLNVIKEINFINCGQFKDRSKFIELPCNVGDTVYRIFENAKGKVIGESKVMGIHSKNHNPCLIIDGWEMQNFKEIGKTVFLTEEEAEQALKRARDKMTNFEKLKADIQGMKANQFLRVCRGLTNYDCKYCIWGKESACKSGCIGGINKWLESEVEE